MPKNTEQIQQARIYAAKTDHQMADSAFDDDYGFASHITESDKIKYVAYHRQLATEIENGEHDHNFTVWQRMNYFLTGECVPFLPDY